MAAVAALYGLLGYVALHAAMRSDGIAYVWPASGVAIGALLLSDRTARIRILAAVFLVSTFVNFEAGSSVGLALWFSFANVVEALVLGRIACNGGRVCGSLNQPLWVARFTIGAMLASCVSAAIATLAGAPTGAAADFFISWSSTVFLGLLVFGPLFIAVIGHVAKIDRWDGIPGWKLQLAFVSVALLSNLLTFGFTGYPVLFLPLMMAVLLTFFMGPFGAAISVFITAVIGWISSATGTGPLAMMDTSEQGRALFFQFYLLVTLASTMPMATVLSQWRATATRLARSHDLLSAAERTAHVGHWQLDLKSMNLFWSDEVFAIHGLEPGGTVDLDAAIQAYHPEDRTWVTQAIDESIATQKPFAFEARLVRPDGSIRYVESNGEPVVENDEVVAMFGVILDITERWQVQEELRRAHSQARQQAREATKLAETDELTGVASRRKFMERLSAEIEVAEQGNRKLSLIVFDIDHFKVFNDSHGHAFGDLVLKLVASEASACIRDRDMIGRIGGEEFAIVMPDGGMDSGTLVAERIRKRVEALQVEDGDGMAQSVSISLGIGEWTPGADEVWLMQAADNALYEAKRSGRNCLRQAA